MFASSPAFDSIRVARGLMDPPSSKPGDPVTRAAPPSAPASVPSVKKQKSLADLIVRIFEFFLSLFCGKPSGKKGLPAEEIERSYEYKLGNTKYQFSDLMQRSGRYYRKFQVDQGRGIVYFRLAYLSGSQGIWRVAPMNLSQGKGVAEDDMALPIDVNLYLHSLPRPKKVAELTTKECDFLAPRGSQETLEYINKFKDAGISLLDTSKKTDALPIKAPYFCWKPEEMKIKDPQNRPDFKRAQKKDNMRIIPSINDDFRYLFIEDGKKVHLAMVEAVKEEITEYGNRAKYVDVGNMTMPLFEYNEQIPLAYTSDERRGRYGSAWNYLKEIPLIQEYCQHFSL